MCDSKELLVGYLYDDLDGPDRRAFDTHLATCPDCRNELAALRATRGQIAAWAPPEPDLGLRMVRGANAAGWKRYSPAWGLAAAAVLVLAASAALANVEVRYTPDGITVRTGWAREATQAAGAAAQGAQTSSTAAPSPADTRGDLDAMRQRLQEIEAMLQRAPEPQAVTASASSNSGMTDAELLRRVRQYISEAQSEQERQVALQMARMFRDFDRQRRTDLAVIEQGLGQYQGMTNTELATTRDMVNQLLRVSTRQEK